MLAVATLVATVLPAAARDGDHDRRDDVRRAVEAGDIKSLADILNTVRAQLPGEVAGVEVERKNGIWLYEFRVVGANGRLYDVYVDARSGTIVRTKEK
ncbi:MAG: PepSY domain-containing protein [Alphaproteobacteria bacterium]|nr:PepSY domain-containing protein [Alphaproteobacteria bacterium]